MAENENGMAPEKAARFIVSVALSKRKKPLYTLGASYKCLSLLIKLLPAGLVNRIIHILYAK